MQSLKILICMLAQVFLCHFQTFMLNFSLSPPSLTLHTRLLTADSATTPLFPTFLNSFNSILLFLIHSAQFSPSPPKITECLVPNLFQVHSVSFLMPTQTGLCHFLLTQTELTSIWPETRLWVHYHPSPK